MGQTDVIDLRRRQELETRPDVAAVVVAGDLVVEITGELDLATAPDVVSRLQPLLASGPFEQVLVHARSVRFCDSTGLQLLLRLQTMLRAKKPTAFLSLSDPLTRLLELSGTRDRFAEPDALVA